MIPELGQFALILALLMAMAQAALPLIGAATNSSQLLNVARPAAYGQFLLLLISFVLLTTSFVQHDFSVAYVANNSNLELPLRYRISAVWAAHEGSLLLWALILAFWTAAVAIRSKPLPLALSGRVVAVMGLISIGFLLFIVLTSNPFERLSPVPFDGRDLNPLLQDFGLIIHPPLLYMGYVGLAVPFAFAVAALMGGKLDAAWTRWMRPWATMAWVFLTVGITLGSWWAYYELGWGGWWFWDPVENASFMPWLVGTALIHSLAVTEKRGLFKSWTVLLAIFAFSLSLLGTFLVRSGILVSVHAFATDPARGVFVLAFLAVVVVGSLTLYGLRANTLQSEGEFRLWSREGFLLLNNLLFTAAAAFVLLGTLAPLLVDVVNGGKISVGPPYFNWIFVPPMLGVAALLGIGPLLSWRKGGDGKALLKQRLPVMLGCAGFAVVFPLLAGRGFHIGVVLSLWLAFWAASAVVLPLITRARRGTLSGMSRSQWGMTIAHAGIAVFIIGVAFLETYAIEKDVRVNAGDRIELDGLTFEFQPVLVLPGPNYLAQAGTVRVYKGSKLVAELLPEKRKYRGENGGNTMTEAGIKGGVMRDIYVSLAEPFDDGSWAARFYVKPFVRWVWGGALLMALGGLLAATDRRYRAEKKRVASTVLAGAVT